MEFWGIEVKPGQTVKVNPGEDHILHLSTAALGEAKKDKASENVPIFVNADGTKLILGTLSADKFPQIQYDIMFEKEFQLSHGSKSSSVYFTGYKSDLAAGYISEDDISLDDIEEDVPTLLSNGKPEGNKKEVKTGSGKPAAKADASSSKPKVTIEEPKVTVPEGEEDSDSDDFDGDSVESDDEDDDLCEDGSEDDDEDSDDDEDEDETPRKTTVGKKRAAEAVKTPTAEKKAKPTPSGGQKTGGEGKKGGHVATPYPSKAKTPVNLDKPKQQTPSKSGSVPCKSCSKTFNSDKALESHSKAKHAAK